MGAALVFAGSLALVVGVVMDGIGKSMPDRRLIPT